MAWNEHLTRADLEAFEDRLFHHINERFDDMTDAFQQSMSDLDAEITAVGDEFKALVSQVASGSITEQAAHDQIEARVAALKAAVAPASGGGGGQPASGGQPAGGGGQPVTPPATG